MKYIERWASESIKRLIPIETQTFEDFTFLLQREGVTIVEARPKTKTLKGTYNLADGDSRNLECCTHFKGSGGAGRTVQLRETYTTLQGPNRSYQLESGAIDMTSAILDHRPHLDAALRTFHTTALRLQQIRERIPGISTVMYSNEGGFDQPFDEEMYAELSERVRNQQVEPWGILGQSDQQASSPIEP